MSLRFEDVTYQYNKDTSYAVTALDSVSLEIPDGQFVGLIGHTGSGKSTLVQHMNGLLSPTSGRVIFNEEDIGQKGYDKKLLRTLVGMVFQYPEHQLFETSVFEDVKFGPKNQGLDEKEASLRAYEALSAVGFPETFFEQSPFELSGGQKRRAAIAGVMAMKPLVLILDEPTAGLDPAGRDEILELIAETHRKMKNTVILVSHSMEDVANYVERIIVMDKAKVFLDGTPREVFSYIEELESIGLAAPRVTYLAHRLKDAGLPVDAGVTTVEEAKREILKALKG